MTKNELKQLIKEVLAEQNALTTLQISTVGGGTTLLLYRGDARGSERSSDKAYKTPTQFKNLIASLNTTGGMTTDEAIKNILKKLTPEQLKQLAREKITVSDRVSEFLGEEASTKELQKLGFKPTKSDVNEAGGYEDGIKDAMDRQKYVALRKLEKAHLAKSKITKDIKKQHHLDMADKYLDQAMAIAKKHGVVDEGKMNEVKGFMLHFNTPEADYMRKNGVMKKKMNSTFKQMMDTRTVKYDDLLKAFPQSTDIVLKDLPSIPKLNTGSVDYFTVDGEGDVVPLKQGDIGSGLD